MAPQRGRKRLWLSLHNSTPNTGQFTFNVDGSPVSGTIMIQGDELYNIFEAAQGKTYSVSVAVDDSRTEEYEWEVSEGLESLVAETSEEGIVFKEMNLL